MTDAANKFTSFSDVASKVIDPAGRLLGFVKEGSGDVGGPRWYAFNSRGHLIRAARTEMGALRVVAGMTLDGRGV